MRAFLSLAITLTALAACAQPGPKPSTQGHRCDPIPPDSVDITGDGIADLVICGQAGVTTLDKSPRVGMCHVVVRTLPGTYLLSSLHPIGGRIIRGFVRGEPIPALDGVPVDPAEAGQDLRDLSRPSEIPRHAFIAGEVRALTWSQAGNTVSAPHRASMAEGVFVFATVEAGRVVHGTFRLRTDPKKRTVRIRPGNRNVGLKPVIVR